MSLGQVLQGAGAIIGQAFSWTGWGAVIAVILIAVGTAISNREQREAARKAKRQARREALAAMQDRTEITRNATTVWRLVLGAVRVGGVQVRFDSVGDNKEYLDQVMVVSANRLSSIEGVYLDDDYLALASLGGPFGDIPPDSSKWRGKKDRRVKSETLAYQASGVYTLALPISPNYGISAYQASSDRSYTYGKDDLHINRATNQVTLDVDAPPGTVNFSYYQVAGSDIPRLRVQVGLGTDFQTASNWTHAGLAIPEWNGTRRLSGCGWLRTLFYWDDNIYASGAPALNVVAKGPYGVYDPRTGTTLEFTDNPALLANWYATLPLQRGGLGWAPSWINEPALIRAADACDALITVKKANGGGYEQIKRYTCNLVIDLGLEDSRIENLNKILDACHGYKVFSAVHGQYLFYAGEFRGDDVTAVINDDDLVPEDDLDVSPGPTGTSLPNVATGTFYDAARGYVQTSATPIRNLAYIEADGGAENSTDVDMQFCDDSRRADYYLGVHLEQQRGGASLQGTVRGVGARLFVGAVVQFNLQDYGPLAGLFFEITSIEDKLNGQWAIAANETRASMYELDADRFTPVNPTPAVDTSYLWDIAAVTGLAVESGDDLLQVQSDGSLIAGARLTWDEHPDGYLRQSGHIEVQYLDPRGIQWINVPNVDGDATSVVIRPLEVGRNYVFAVRGVNGIGASGSWAEQSHVVNGKGYPPPNVTGLAVSFDILLGSLITITPVVALDLDHYELRILAGEDEETSWEDAFAVARLGRADKSGIFVAGLLPLGEHTVLVKAFDTSGNESLNVYRQVVNVPGVAAIHPEAITYEFQDPVTALTNSTVTLHWPQQSPLFGLKGYLVRYSDDAGETWNDEPFFTSAASITLPAGWIGERLYGHRVQDVRDLLSEETVITITKQPPGAVPDLTGYAIRNTLTAQWQAAPKTSLPISHYHLRLNGGEPRRVDNLRETLSELQGGPLIVSVSAVDTDGYEGSAIERIFQTYDPPDFVFHSKIIDDWSGTLVNAVVDVDGSLILPVDTERTREELFTARGWTTAQEKADAGYPVRMAPAHASLTAYSELESDLGLVLPSMGLQVTVSPALLALTSGAFTVRITLTTALDALFTVGVVSETVESASLNVVRNNFRFIKTRITVIVSADTALVRLPAASVAAVLSVFVQSWQYSAVTSYGGAYAQGNLAPQTFGLGPDNEQPAGWSKKGGADTHIEAGLDVGPGGDFEPVWAMWDTVGGSGSVGEQCDVTLPEDEERGVLLAMWVKREAAAGAAAIEVDGGEFEELGGSAGITPFAQANTPTEDGSTWYLMAAYLNGAAATTDTGLSGFYDDAGTRVSALGEKRRVSGVTALHGLAFTQASAIDGDTAFTQSICRPVAIACSPAELPAIIDYLILCATQPGAAVHLPTGVIDLISNTPSAVSYGKPGQLTALPADFDDTPNPRFFNVFAQDGTTSALVNGATVSGSVRFV